jgi:predicted 2-oxoglutarate/Fe(II)-dependent dioxygenase YbiX
MDTVILTKEDCEFILSNLDYSKFKQGKSTVHDIATIEGEDIKVRFRKENSATFILIRDGVIMNFLFEKLKSKLNLVNLPTFKIMKYEIGDGMANHQDFDKYGASPIYKSISIQLSDSSHYTGGDLILEGQVQPRTQGYISIFNPTQEHGITNVISGTRLAIVIFFEEADFNISKSII